MGHVQELAIQAMLDVPVCEELIASMRDDALALGMPEETLRERVVGGVALARALDAAWGFELKAVVALSVFFHPRFTEVEPIDAVFADRAMSLEAKLRFVSTMLLQGG